MKKNTFSGTKKDLLRMLFEYCRMVDRGEIQDKAEILIKIENAKKSSIYLNGSTLAEIN